MQCRIWACHVSLTSNSLINFPAIVSDDYSVTSLVLYIPHWYIPFLHSHVTFFRIFHLFWWFVCDFFVFLLFHLRWLVFYFTGTCQTLTSPFCYTFIQVGFHLKPPHLYIFMISVFSLFTPCTFSLIFTHFTLPIIPFIYYLFLCVIGLGYIHSWFSSFLFHFIRPCVLVHFLGPLIQFSISFLHCLLSVCIKVLASVPYFHSINFPYVILVPSSHHAGLGHIVLGVSSFLFRFHVHMVIVGVDNILPDWLFSFISIAF